MTIKFTVYGIPIPKARARMVVNKAKGFIHSYTPKATVAYESLIAGVAYKHKAKGGLLTGPVSMTLKIYRDIPKSFSQKKRAAAESGELLPITKPDSSNILKSVEDSLNGIIYVDDSQICHHEIWKKYSITPRVEIEITEAE